VATTDPIHHGAGYGTRPEERRSREESATLEWARGVVEGQLARLASGDYGGFQTEAARVRSDFRDTGPTAAALMRARGAPLRGRVHDMVLVDYAATLGSPAPTWVCAPLLELSVA
jgi:hypothetical protein